MSRDPEDGKIKDPKTLHKYLYADGDPVNRIDPRGREGALVEYAATLAHNTFEGTIYGTHMKKCVSNAYSQAGDLLGAILSNTPTDLTGEGIGMTLVSGGSAANYDLAVGFIVGHIFPYPGQDCE
jgi:hypothetical protein